MCRASDFYSDPNFTKSLRHRRASDHRTGAGTVVLGRGPQYRVQLQKVGRRFEAARPRAGRALRASTAACARRATMFAPAANTSRRPAERHRLTARLDCALDGSLAPVDLATMISPNAAVILGSDAVTGCVFSGDNKAIERAEKAVHLATSAVARIPNARHPATRLRDRYCPQRSGASRTTASGSKSRVSIQQSPRPRSPSSSRIEPESFVTGAIPVSGKTVALSSRERAPRRTFGGTGDRAQYSWRYLNHGLWPCWAGHRGSDRNVRLPWIKLAIIGSAGLEENEPGVLAAGSLHLARGHNTKLPLGRRGLRLPELMRSTVHRREHAVPLFWRLHALHDSDLAGVTSRWATTRPSTLVYWILLGIPAVVLAIHRLAVFGVAAVQPGNIYPPE